MMTRKFAKPLLSALLLGMLSACGSVSQGIAEDGNSAQQLVWPSVTSINSLSKRGSYPTPEALALLHPGMEKMQVLTLVGPPHFNEGMGDVREWDYVFQVRATDAAEFKTCQMKALFDRDGRVGSLYWLPVNCAPGQPVAVARPAPATPAAAVTPPPPAVYTLSAAALFAFDEASLTHMPAQGRTALAALAADLRQSGRTVRRIQVAAHTDRLGSPAYNRDLSLRRARSVRDYLVAQGVPASQIEAVGLGASQPVSQGCAATLPRQDLIACLAPDRRVVVTVNWARP